MKKSEELNLSEQTQFIRNFAKRHADLQSFYSSINSLNIISIQDLSFKNDIELFREIAFILSVIYSIISKPHMNNRRDEIIARSGEASSLSEDDFQKTLRDSSLWKDMDGFNLLPEYVYYHQYEDDLRIYENIFIVHMINEISFIIDSYLSLYISLLKVKESNNKELVIGDSIQEDALRTANKLSRRINQIKESYFYRDVSKAKNKPKVFYPTNILVKDRLYNLVYKFYKKMYIYQDKKDIDKELYLFYFSLLLSLLHEDGYELDSRNKALIFENNEIVLPKKMFFTSSDLRLSIQTNVEENSFLVSYKDKLEEVSNTHLLILTNDATFEESKVVLPTEEIFSTEYLSLWHLGEIGKDQKIHLINETLMSEKELLKYFLNSHHDIYSGSEIIYSSYCPVCKSKNIFQNKGHIFCDDCGAIYKFAKTKGSKGFNKLIFAKYTGRRYGN